ncbi:hypothetical protein [Puia dinghuensis]|uniref:Lipocalin-like domain-containing protein n=1 Tax=Puia dinghuensis TaxID=1792502 RepID=A0A8J2UG12_9BACT|nr:hypothetical protein [Puia dinghuensis]GGB12069.1 hypothetical protein GCM10011511_39600 [Puia dinghuensis]
MRKLKFIFSAAALVVSIVSLISVGGCTKNTTYQTKDSVYYSGWMTLSMTGTNHDSLWYEDIAAKSVTASVLRSGAVLGYVGSASSGDTTALSASEYGFSQILNVGNIELQYYLTDQSGLLYRYVVIPGNVLTTTFKNFSQDQLKRMSFTDVQKAINTQGASSGQGNTLH